MSVDSMHFESYYILVFVDLFSRRLMTFPFRALTGAKVAESIRQVRHQLGDLDVLHTDRGTEFVNVSVARLATELQFKHIKTTAQQPSKTSIPERRANVALSFLFLLLFFYLLLLNLRFIRTIRKRLGRMRSANEFRNVPAAMERVTYGINHSPSRAIGGRIPSSVTSELEIECVRLSGSFRFCLL
ncbi:MAG: transposase family protein [Planctomycetaceae bacterium]|nr:transposase family protein [Planctomycetaceae bacterium]